MSRDEINALSNRAIGAAIEVHRNLGPGLLRSAYEGCLVRELDLQGIGYERRIAMPVNYKGITVDAGYQLDFLVEKELILIVKAVETITDVHKAQLLSYLRLSERWLGLLFNFNVPRMVDGIYRRVNG